MEKTAILMSILLVCLFFYTPIAQCDPVIIVGAGQLDQKYTPGQTHNVRKKNGSIDNRENDLEELARDYVFFRNQILKHSRAGNSKKAAKAREDFQQINRWLSAYNDADVHFMIKVAEGR